MSFVNTERRFENDGPTPCRRSNAKLSVTSAPAVRPLWADISNSVMGAPTS